MRFDVPYQLEYGPRNKLLAPGHRTAASFGVPGLDVSRNAREGSTPEISSVHFLAGHARLSERPMTTCRVTALTLSPSASAMM